MTVGREKSPAAPPPMILAPAGNRAAFLAALAAGADAVYCGLKQFSARMAAKNFTIAELAALTHLAHRKQVQVYVAFNTMLTTSDLPRVRADLEGLAGQVQPDALIVQDMGLIALARQAGFGGEIHLSTLANVGFPEALAWVRRNLGVDRVVTPRELDIDELRALAQACPAALGLEVFVHGALCYGVSGRCYWSSYLGGKSGLRGRCVQPCRRIYRQQRRARRLFACLDLSLDVLARVLRTIPQVRAWKIEGRKKGPHYVFYTVSAYRLLRDAGDDPQSKKAALGLLEQALGRPTSHYRFLPQRPQSPLQPGIQTGSGLQVGTVKGAARALYFNPRLALLPGDALRIGYEDDPGHALLRLRQSVPARGRFALKPQRGRPLKPNAPVFLTDRREAALQEMIESLERELAAIVAPHAKPQPAVPRQNLPRRRFKGRAQHLTLFREAAALPARGAAGTWAAPEALTRVAAARVKSVWWWLSPALWPDEAAAVRDTLQHLRNQGARRFVLNAPWQAALLPDARGLELWAGPFCNLANAEALQMLADAGFSGAFVSPELGQEDFLSLPAQSPLPLGMVLTGLWPLCISRILAADVAENEAFTSPRGEQAWAVRHHGSYWLFPNWPIDLRSQQAQLEASGYRWFAHIREPLPPGVKLKVREGLWNWQGGLD
jgi:putative protease